MFDPDRSPNSNSPSKPQVILSLGTAVILMRCEFIISLIQKIHYLSRGNHIIAVAATNNLYIFQDKVN